jgi:hypothetical protein
VKTAGPGWDARQTAMSGREHKNHANLVKHSVLVSHNVTILHLPIFTVIDVGPMCYESRCDFFGMPTHGHDISANFQVVSM